MTIQEDMFQADHATELLFWVDGTPVPQGSMSAFMPKGAKHPIVTSNNKNLKPWRKRMMDRFNIIMGIYKERPAIPSGPVEMKLIFKMPRTKNKKMFWVDVKPDLDKLIRAVGDSLTDAGAIEDDSDVCVLYAIKRYARVHETPGVLLSIKQIKEDEEPELFRDLEVKGEYLKRYDETIRPEIKNQVNAYKKRRGPKGP